MPTQRINFLGFVTNSFQMILEITEEKKYKIHNLEMFRMFRNSSKRKNDFSDYS